MNYDAIKGIIHQQDQEIFSIFNQTEIISGGEVDLKQTKKIKYSLWPHESIHLDEFNFTVHINKEYFGAESTEVVAEGIVTCLDGAEIPFTAPIPLVKLQYELGKFKTREKVEI